ncbi:hypothetical protein [Mesorhizobium sp. SP-1A]|uniref:hypothetical protein n=1 Tax=Mesorhizobium sp. SP-1A TaxID=3077840 RepID=UPI0028F74AD9|nr:hypothetical protein [Mesorhizobium sp. SP-1A]
MKRDEYRRAGSAQGVSVLPKAIPGKARRAFPSAVSESLLKRPARRLGIAASLLAALTLAACNSSSVLEPSAITPQQKAQAATGQGTATTVQPGTTAPAPQPLSAAAKAVIGKMRLQVAPIVGAPVEAAGPLTERLNQRSRERGITLVGSSDQTATHVLKGYFSTMTEGKDTTVIYVWDVYDPSGNRLHRINGQQKAASVNGGEGWAAVAPATMQSIADTTVDQLAAWVGGQTG